MEKNIHRIKMLKGPLKVRGLSHSYTCNLTTMICAHFGLIYCITCLVYLIVTRCAGTPFMDSLTEDQKKIKKESARVRGQAFLLSAIVGFVLVHVLKPFKEA